MNVRVLYRADIRKPDDVFKKGFTAWGTNVNFISHVLGISGVLGERNSAFIPTTANYDIALSFAKERALLNNMPYYVYTIRGTDNIYSAMETTYHIYDLYNKRVGDELRTALAKEQEYAAYQHISPEQVMSVDIITEESGKWIVVKENNPDYKALETSVHDGPYTGGDKYPPDLKTRLVVGISPENSVGAEFLPENDYGRRRTSSIWCYPCNAVSSEKDDIL